MTTVPTKIVLKSTTRMSLNDRFSNITPTIQNIRANIAAEHQVSAANRRLAQQLANRPGLQGAPVNVYQMQPPYRDGRQGNINVGPNRKNLQQRLGRGNIKNRLSMPRGQPLRGRGRGRGRGGIRPVQNGAGDNQWVANKTQERGGFTPRRGRGGRGVFRGRGRGTFNRMDENRGGDEGGNRGGRGSLGKTHLSGEEEEVARGNRRGMRRGGRGQPRGRGTTGRGGSNNSNVTVQELDSQLDEYMTQSRSHLDAELDAYMSEVNN
ncbi:unnamed protein product [Candidula unifasciata]|uniref:Chromatin target of PRMT1 protein C-terminal domain-containing protein n=1 Tax=Candidula unifasciata TaxID=100452 RepID=A0A8S3Z9T5_9EUPU|nr:unnamed protein product [Candidula unifasciata]